MYHPVWNKSRPFCSIFRSADKFRGRFIHFFHFCFYLIECKTQDKFYFRTVFCCLLNKKKWIYWFQLRINFLCAEIKRNWTTMWSSNFSHLPLLHDIRTIQTVNGEARMLTSSRVVHRHILRLIARLSEDRILLDPTRVSKPYKFPTYHSIIYANGMSERTPYCFLQGGWK
jgi:hypothetical protein